VDTDFECLAPFDDIHADTQFYTGFSNTAAAAEVCAVRFFKLSFYLLCT